MQWAAVASRACGCVALATLSLSLQGCSHLTRSMLEDVPRVDGYIGLGNIKIPTHSLPKWRQKQSYWKTFKFRIPPKNPLLPNATQPPGYIETVTPDFDSCNNPNVSTLDVCSGNGACFPWDPEDLANPLSFCQCHDKWAGPECNQKRKSQMMAWALSMGIGYTGADLFYLGFPYYGVAKLVSSVASGSIALVAPSIGVPAFAAWWLIDVVRIGSAPCYANNYRVANDLPRWAFSIFSFLFMSILGFGLSASSIYWVVINKRRMADAAMLEGLGVKVL